MIIDHAITTVLVSVSTPEAVLRGRMTSESSTTAVDALSISAPFMTSSSASASPGARVTSVALRDRAIIPGNLKIGPFALVLLTPPALLYDFTCRGPFMDWFQDWFRSRAEADDLIERFDPRPGQRIMGRWGRAELSRRHNGG